MRPAALFDIRPVTDRAVGGLAGQKVRHAIREGADPTLLFDRLCELVAAHGVESVAVAAYCNEIGKSLR